MREFKDEDLVREVKKGNDEAFNELVLKYMKKAYYVAYRYMKKEEDAKDMVQEAFLKVFINIDKFDEKYNFSSWFFRILINCCINTLKKQNKRKFLFDSFGKDKESDLDKLEIGKETSTKTPEECLIHKESSKIIMDGINTLPEKQKDVLILYDIEGFSQNEVSQILNIPVGSVMSRLFYGRKKLKKYFEKVGKVIF